MNRYDELVAALRKEFPTLRIIRKDRSPLHRAIHGFLVAVTLGKMRDYLSSYQTTIGSTVYVTSDWDEWDPDERYVTMRHEAVHLRQFRRWTLPGMALAYVFLPLPLGLAWCRAAFEKTAYAETLRASREVWGRDRIIDPAFRRHIVEQFVSASYGWMWPFRRSIERWYDGVLRALDAEALPKVR